MKNRLIFSRIMLICVIGWSAASCGGKFQIAPEGLTCEYMENPAVVDAAHPRLSWINRPFSDRTRGAEQQAYRICVASSREKLLAGDADMWDTGQVPSNQSSLVPYNGEMLQSGKDCWWRVMVWDGDGRESKWSQPAMWGMGILEKQEWKADWIGAAWQDEWKSGEEAAEGIKQAPSPVSLKQAPLLRKTFEVKDNVVQAKAFVTGLGYFEFYVNGQKAGDDCLVPNFTNYTDRPAIEQARGIAIENNFRGHRVMYLAYDITEMLREGKNAAGAILGDGFYKSSSRWVASFGAPRFLCQIEITYGDGTTETVCSDASWKARMSPIVMNGVYDGEVYDANMETEGWCMPELDDAGWMPASPREAPTGELTAHTAPTDKVVERLKPLTLTRNADGAWEVDFGVEVSGWIRFEKMKGRKGDTLDVRYICESPLGVQRYVFKGDGEEQYAPRFTWYVFSKAVITGVDVLSADMLTAEAVNTDVPVTAEFRTSNPMFEQINKIWQRSQMDNMHGGIASDCPHRERAPYTGDGQVACATVMHNFDAAAFYQKWIRDMRDAQNVSTGYVPNGAPWQPGCGGGVPWGAAMNIMPWEFYVHYGDRKMLSDNYEAMKEQVRYMLTWRTADGTMFSQRTNINSDKVNYWMNLGDWCPPFKNPPDELVHTFYMWLCADITAKAARALGFADDVSHYSALADDIKKAFHGKFYDAENATYGDYGANIFALVTGISKETHYPDVLQTLNQEITERYDGHLNTGIYGTRFFFETLAAHGMNEVAYGAMSKQDYPSYGHWLEQGATVTWEQWNGKNSRNHPMFGGGLTWFYRTLAGIRTDENEPGYRHIIVKPELPATMEHVFYSNMTPYGKVASEVKRTDRHLEMVVTVPVGSYATVYIPAKVAANVTESGRSLESAQGVEFVGDENGCTVVKVLQGTYRFVVAE